MSFDQTTESIVHFAGLFHLAIEEIRLRDDYLEFKSAKAEAWEDAKIEFTQLKLSAPYRIGDYDPKSGNMGNTSQLTPNGGAQGGDLPPTASAVAAASPEAPEQPKIPEFGEGSSSGASKAFKGPGSSDDADGTGLTITKLILLPFVPVPPTLAVVTLQSAILYDNDVLGDPDAAGFEALAPLFAAFQSVIAFAEAVQPWSSDGLAEAVLDGPTAAIEFMASFQDVDEASAPNAAVLRGDDVEAVVVNGEVVDDFPDIEAFLPQFIQNKRQDDDQENDAVANLAGSEKDGAGLFDSQTGYHETFADSAHNVISGANESHNVVDIYTKWIDAQVFAVGGDVIDLNAISQTNILWDADTVNGQFNSNDMLASKALNAAKMDLEPSPEGLESGLNESLAFAEQSVDDDPFVLPSIWNLERYEGDVVVSNVVEQYSFSTDFDRLDVTISAHSSIVSSGENQLFNQYAANEFGFGYDLVVVGGSMMSMNVIQQTNVLLDNDMFSGDGLGAASISGNDNSLMNIAEITQSGYDQQADMAQEFRDAVRDLADGAADLAREVARSELFEGNELLRALYIEGDLIQMNIVDQINYMGDVDQIQLMAENMLSVVDDMPVAITAGSNLLTNTATINQDGTDSIVMAEGSHYSDALLVQAELIETDATPLGVNIAGLVNEAVAFLAEDMIAAALPMPVETDLHAHDAHTGGTTFDVMQTLTA